MAERPTSGITPFLTIRGKRALDALDFYARAFDAELIEKNMAEESGRVMQASLKINGGWLMLSDEFPEWRGYDEPEPKGVTLHLQVDDADSWAERAVAAGAEIVMPVADQFWGDRYGQLSDPFGHMWSIGSPTKG